MSGDCFHGGSSFCRISNVGTNEGHPKIFDTLPFPLPPWPPNHQTAATTLARSSTISRISSVLPQSSNGALTSAANRKTLQSPSAGAPSSSSLKATSVRRSAVPSTNIVVHPTSFSTAAVISILKSSNAVSLATPAATSLPTIISVASLTTSRPATLTFSFSSNPFTSSGPSVPSSLTSAVFMSVTSIVSPTISIEAESQQTQAIGITQKVEPRKMDMVAGIVIGIILGVLFLSLPLTYYIWRRRVTKRAHRRSIGGIEKDSMFRPWKKSEMNLRRRTANMASLYYPADKGSDQISLPPPAFAPLRPNRSSSLYSGSLLNGFEHLSPQEETPRNWSPSNAKSFDTESIESLPLSEKRSSYGSAGYVYSEDPFEVPLIAPDAQRPVSVVSIVTASTDATLKPPRGYKGPIKFGMGVQKTSR